MIIPIQTKGGSQVWSVVELQGELVGVENMNDVTIGTITMEDGDVPVLRIGCHTLRGEVRKLAKPFAVLRKVKRMQEQDVNGGMSCGD